MYEIPLADVCIFYLVFINVIGFTVIAVDKYRSIKKKWRIMEKTFFFLALVGGGIGIYFGMRVCHHKTKHRYFMWGIPAIVIMQMILIYLILSKW